MDVNIYKNKPENFGYPSRHPLYRCWASMKNRCYNEKDVRNYEWYGGRGIRVCERWIGKNGFWNFVEDMGEKPKGYSIDRVDTNKDYSPENCRWASPKEQSYNRRNNLVFEIGGEKLNTEQAAKKLHKHPETLRKRLRLGFSPDDVIASFNIRRSKKVKCVETGVVFDSIMSAAREYGVAYQGIANCVHGRGKTAAGKHWIFAENAKEIKDFLKEIA